MRVGRLQGGGSFTFIYTVYHSWRWWLSACLQRAGGRCQLVIPDRNVTGVLYFIIPRENLLPWGVQTYVNNFCYQDDNAPTHRARLVRDFMEQECLTVLHQPAISPDCKPIEHLWDELQHAVESRDVKPRNLQELGQALREKWPQRADNTLHNLVDNMLRHIAACQMLKEVTLVIKRLLILLKILKL